MIKFIYKLSNKERQKHVLNYTDYNIDKTSNFSFKVNKSI